MGKKKPHIGEGHGGYFEAIRAKAKALREKIAAGKMSPKDGNA